MLETNYELTDSQRSLVTDVISKCGGGSDDVTPKSGGREPSTTDDQPVVKPSSRGKDDDDDQKTSSAATALIVVACLASAAVGLALLYVFWTKRRGGFQNLRTAFAPLPGTPSAFDSPFGGAAWSQPETPGVASAPPSFEDHVTNNPMRGGYEAPGLGDAEGV